MGKYILALDQGTTGSTALIIDATNFKIISKKNNEFPQIFPEPGMVEHNPSDIWNSIRKSTLEAIKIANIDVSDISCIGITNQRETIVSFNKSGEPLYNALVWQDRRTEDLCTQLQKEHPEIQNLTGLPIDPYFSGTKVNWLLSNVEAVKKAKATDDLYFGNIDTFLLYKLTAGNSYKTDVSNASRTLFMNLEKCIWDKKLLEIFGVGVENLPEICDSIGEFGKTKGLDFLPDGIPITGILGDQQSALFGQTCLDENSFKCTYGTGAFALLNTGEKIKRSKNGLLSTVFYRYQGKTFYALEGSCYIAGAAVQWLRDQLNLVEDSPAIESLANTAQVEKMHDVLFMPFFTGIGSPHWISNAKATITGLTRDTNDSHIARACLEGVAFSINDLISAFEEDMGKSIDQIKVDGGMTNNKLFLQIQSDVSSKIIIKPHYIETTAYGAALAAAIGANLLNLSDVKKHWQADSNIEPSEIDREYFNNKYQLWLTTINRLYK